MPKTKEMGMQLSMQLMGASSSYFKHPEEDTHTTTTVRVHQMLVKGLFFHSGLVRWTWVTDINTVKKSIF